MTLQGIALALRRPLKLNVEALKLVKERYRKLETRSMLTFYRKKMATIPRGASALPNPIGTAPGVMTQVAGTTMFSLPGVPSEMKAIFRRSIIPFLKRSNATPPKEAQLKIVGIIESALAPILDEARRAFPGLYIKSHPRGRETGGRPLILLHIYNVDSRFEKKVVEAADYVTRKLSNIR